MSDLFLDDQVRSLTPANPLPPDASARPCISWPHWKCISPSDLCLPALRCLRLTEKTWWLIRSRPLSLHGAAPIATLDRSMSASRTFAKHLQLAYRRDSWIGQRRCGHPDFDGSKSSLGIGIYRKEPTTKLGSSGRNQSISILLAQ
jgi:hypothetical protein